MYVVKKTGKKERFDERKVFKSSYKACLGSGIDEKTARKISQNITNEIKKLVKGKKEIKSDLIFNKVKSMLSRQSKECAFMYETYRDIS